LHHLPANAKPSSFASSYGHFKPSCSCHRDGQALQPYLRGGPLQVSFTAHHLPAKPPQETTPTSASDEITCCFTLLLQNLAFRVTSTTEASKPPVAAAGANADLGFEGISTCPSIPRSSAHLQPCQRLTQAPRRLPRERAAARADTDPSPHTISIRHWWLTSACGRKSRSISLFGLGFLHDLPHHFTPL